MTDELEIKCSKCRTTYNRKISGYSGSLIGSYKEHHYGCPRCGYNQDMEWDIRHSLEKNTAFTLHDGEISVNSEEMSELISKIVRGYWPKPKDKKMADETQNISRLCRFAEIKSHRRGVYALCCRTKDEEGCVGNEWYDTGHSTLDSDIDAKKVMSCTHRQEIK